MREKNTRKLLLVATLLAGLGGHACSGQGGGSSLSGQPRPEIPCPSPFPQGVDGVGGAFSESCVRGVASWPFLLPDMPDSYDRPEFRIEFDESGTPWSLTAIYRPFDPERLPLVALMTFYPASRIMVPDDPYKTVRVEGHDVALRELLPGKVPDIAAYWQQSGVEYQLEVMRQGSTRDDNEKVAMKLVAELLQRGEAE